MTRNQDVAALLYEIAQILDVQQVPFKPRAYQRAAMNIEALGEDIESVAAAGKLAEIPGVGKAIADKVQDYLRTGRLPYLEKIRKQLPPGVLALMAIPGIGPKTALRLQKELDVHSVAQLKRAALRGRIRHLKGFGEKSEKEILDGISRLETAPKRFPYPTALEVANDLLGRLRKLPGVERAEAAGSLRRGRDTVGDLDLLVIAPPSKAESIVNEFKHQPEVRSVLESGTTRARVLLSNGFQVDARIVPQESFGAAWMYFTGSKDHNIALRTLALKKGWTINEYALAQKKGAKRIAGSSEEEIYKKLGLAWIPPEIRENVGEIDAAKNGTLPRLVETGDLRGDLHAHTTESDGHGSAQEMVEEAQALGYEWFGVSDHSKGLGIARGLDGDRYAKQRKALGKLQKDFPKIRLLQGAEVNIRKDGSLDLDRKTLQSLDYVIGSVHSSFDLEAKEQTRRVVKAIEEGISVLGHPSGRLLGERPELRLEWDAILDACKERGTILEIDSTPFRLDLNGERSRAARERGLMFAIDSDAHSRSGMRLMHFGVTQARRGGLGPKDVVNTRTFAALRDVLQ